MELAVENYRPVALLDDGLINQIAAGEVVERPASAVKELLENSLDAGATQLALHLTHGGITEIRLIDNGRGMTHSDLAICTQRHTTSKIRQSADLEGIGTFGFRGEALSSIASVAKVEIRTRRPQESLGHLSKIYFGERVGEITSCGTAPGTTLIVSELFSNVPARQKYLRSATTEFSHIARAFREQALGNPEVEFSLTHNERATYRFLKNDRKGRVSEVLRPDYEIFVVEEAEEFGSLQAYLTPPHWISDKGELTFFVNRRPVKNRSLLAAIRNSYAQTVGPHHEPSGVVYLDLRLDWVDVNVHPQKWEVRCYHQEKIYSWMQAVLKKAISSRQTVRSLAIADSEPEQIPFGSAPVAAPRPGSASQNFSSAPRTPYAAPSITPLPFRQPTAEPVPTIMPPALSGFRYLGQTGASYLVGEDDQGLVLFDQHALHEKQTFEKLRASQGHQSSLSQPLLVPQIVRFEKELVAAIDKYGSALRKLGFEAEAFGDGDVAIKAHPVLVDAARAADLLKAALRVLLESNEAGETATAEQVEGWYRRIFATWACHGSVRAGQRLSEVEARALIERLPQLEEGWTCPHGRPVLFRMSWPYLAKQFERG